MKSDEDIYKAICGSIETVVGSTELRLKPETKLVGDLGIESIDVIDVLFEIEKTLGISINLAAIFQSFRRDTGQSNQFDLEIRQIAEYIAKALRDRPQ